MNVGIVGHVDAGKTTLAKAISTIESTSAFDKPSKSAPHLRANTTELGISAVDLQRDEDGSERRITLIDCPGHFAFIRTVLAASSVFDGAICVINADKGVEIQTAEHLILASVLCPHRVLVVINKTDLVTSERAEQLIKKLPKFLESIGVDPHSQIISVSLTETHRAEAISKLRGALKNLYFHPQRAVGDVFLMAVDHCFPVRGKGTVATGTVVAGRCLVGMTVQLPHLDNETRRVRAIQSWKEEVKEVSAGERAALLLPDLSKPEDYKRLGRTLLSSPGALTCTSSILASILPIKQFRHELRNRARVMIAAGFESSTAECHFLRSASIADEMEEYEVAEHGSAAEDRIACDRVLLRLEQPMHLRPDTMYLAIKLDIQKKNECRLAFHGQVLSVDEGILAHLSIFRKKTREGVVERVHDARTLICRGLFKKETDIAAFNRMLVHIGPFTGMEEEDSLWVEGHLEGSFGKQGKCRVTLREDIPAKIAGQIEKGVVKVELRLKVYKHSSKKVVAY